MPSVSFASTELGFTNQESFGLFMEGLRSIQLYGDESDKEHPAKRILDDRIRDAVDRLCECVEFYPDDPLPRYYFGIALATLNQHTYIARLHEIEDSFTAWGTLIALNAQAAPAAAAVEAATGRSIDARLLEHEPWPLLREASLHFKNLIVPRPNDPGARVRQELSRSLAYNLAEVYARLGRPHELVEALKILRRIPGIPTAPAATSWLSRIWTMRPFIDLHFAAQSSKLAADEEVALNRQTRTMWYSLKARLCIRFLGNPQNPAAPPNPKTVATLSAMLDRLKDSADVTGSQLSLRLKDDVCADRLTKLGYVNFLQALTPKARIGASIDALLSDAEQHFVSALELKANWNPAQIYLAMVYRIHSGVCGVLNQPAQQERFKRKSDALFASLLGLKPAATPPEPTHVKLEGDINLGHRVTLLPDEPPPAVPAGP